MTPTTLVPAPITSPAPSARGVSDLARLVFDALEEVHRLSPHDAELLARAAAGLRFIRSAGDHPELDCSLFRVALVDLADEDAWIVESAARYAAEHVAACGPDTSRPASSAVRTRALWLTAVLRLADALSAGRAAPSGAYAAWTPETLYLEFDGAALSEAQLDRARGRVAALELLVARRVILARSAARRGAA